MSKEELNKQKKNKAKEPEIAYQFEGIAKNLTISSFDKLEELDRQHTAELSPEQRLEYLRKLNENLYGFDLSKQEEKLRKGHLIIRKES